MHQHTMELQQRRNQQQTFHHNHVNFHEIRLRAKQLTFYIYYEFLQRRD
jgi:hypothetical protein